MNIHIPLDFDEEFPKIGSSQPFGFYKLERKKTNLLSSDPHKWHCFYCYDSNLEDGMVEFDQIYVKYYSSFKLRLDTGRLFTSNIRVSYDQSTYSQDEIETIELDLHGLSEALKSIKDDPINRVMKKQLITYNAPTNYIIEKEREKFTIPPNLLRNKEKDVISFEEKNSFFYPSLFISIIIGLLIIETFRRVRKILNETEQLVTVEVEGIVETLGQEEIECVGWDKYYKRAVDSPDFTDNPLFTAGDSSSPAPNSKNKKTMSTAKENSVIKRDEIDTPWIQKEQNIQQFIDTPIDNSTDYIVKQEKLCSSQQSFLTFDSEDQSQISRGGPTFRQTYTPDSDDEISPLPGSGTVSQALGVKHHIPRRVFGSGGSLISKMTASDVSSHDKMQFKLMFSPDSDDETEAGKSHVSKSPLPLNGVTAKETYQEGAGLIGDFLLEEVESEGESENTSVEQSNSTAFSDLTTSHDALMKETNTFRGALRSVLGTEKPRGKDGEKGGLVKDRVNLFEKNSPGGKKAPRSLSPMKAMKAVWKRGKKAEDDKSVHDSSTVTTRQSDATEGSENTMKRSSFVKSHFNISYPKHLLKAVSPAKDLLISPHRKQVSKGLLKSPFSARFKFMSKSQPTTPIQNHSFEVEKGSPVGSERQSGEKLRETHDVKGILNRRKEFDMDLYMKLTKSEPRPRRVNILGTKKISSGRGSEVIQELEGNGTPGTSVNSSKDSDLIENKSLLHSKVGISPLPMKLEEMSFIDFSNEGLSNSPSAFGNKKEGISRSLF